MNDREFNTLTDALLMRIERALEASGIDLDFERASPGVLEVEFADGHKIVINRHAASQEMWVAARSGGYHYRYDGREWRDTRGGENILSALSALITAHAGVPFSLQDFQG